MLYEVPPRRTTCKSIRSRKIIWSTIRAQSVRAIIRRAPRIWTWSRGWSPRMKATLVSTSPARSTTSRKLEARIAKAERNHILEWKRWRSYSQDSKVRPWWTNPTEVGPTCRSKRLLSRSIKEARTKIPASSASTHLSVAIKMMPTEKVLV